MNQPSSHEEPRLHSPRQPSPERADTPNAPPLTFRDIDRFVAELELEENQRIAEIATYALEKGQALEVESIVQRVNKDLAALATQVNGYTVPYDPGVNDDPDA